MIIKDASKCEIDILLKDGWQINFVDNSGLGMTKLSDKPLEISKPLGFNRCRFCEGTGIEERGKSITVFGRELKNISEVITYAYQNGYVDK